LKVLKHFQFVDAVTRCAFLIDDELALRLSDHERAQAWFEVHAGNDTVHFPLAQVLHFPQASPIIAGGLLPRPTNGFPSAPWAAAEAQVVRPRVRRHAAGGRRGLQEVRLAATGRRAVAALDARRGGGRSRGDQRRHARPADGGGARVLAQHESLAERVTLVDLDFPNYESNHAYEYLAQAQAHELFLRWQADFDFIFLIDHDEFPQLFNTNAKAHQPRIDIKTFIGHNGKSFEELGQVYFSRPFVQRSEGNKNPDPLLPTFLRELAPLDGLVTSAVWSDRSKPLESLGKALFPVGAALRPYLHFNDHWPGLTFFDWRAGHVLHVRQPLNDQTVAAQLQWFVDEFAHRTARNQSQKH
jgi:hypothetical protein